MKGFAVAKVASSKARAVRGPPYSRARLAAMAVHAVRNDVARLVYRIPHGCLRGVSLFDVALRQSFPPDAHASARARRRRHRAAHHQGSGAVRLRRRAMRDQQVLEHRVYLSRAVEPRARAAFAPARSQLTGRATNKSHAGLAAARRYSSALAPTATHARSAPETEATLNFFAAAAMRSSA